MELAANPRARFILASGRNVSLRAEESRGKYLMFPRPLRAVAAIFAARQRDNAMKAGDASVARNSPHLPHRRNISAKIQCSDISIIPLIRLLRHYPRVKTARRVRLDVNVSRALLAHYAGYFPIEFPRDPTAA